MTSLDTLNPSAQQTLQPERTVGSTEIYPVAPEFDALSQKLIGQANDYLYDTSGTPPAPTSAIVQRDAYSKGEENQREHFVHQLTRALDVDVDEALHRFDVANRDQEGSDVATLLPWMKASLGMPNPQEPVNAPGCTLRLARLNFERQAPLTLRELEVPTVVTNNETGESEQRVARFMWMTTD